MKFLMKHLRVINIMLMFFVASYNCLAQAEIIIDTIADSRSDFSVAYQGVNGFQYGFYDRDDVTGVFTTQDMYADNGRWAGPGNFKTPLISTTFMHPDNWNHPAVRRYTVGSDQEPVIDGLVIIEGKFWDQQTGGTNGSLGFVTVNGKNLFNERIVEESTESDGFISFKIVAEVQQGTTIDIGITALGSYGSDGRGMEAFIGTLAEIPLNISAFPLNYRSVELSWQDNSNEETNFILEISNALSEGYEEVTTLAANTTIYTYEDLSGGEDIYFRIKTQKGNDIIGYSTPYNYVNMPTGASEMLAETKADFSVAYQGVNGFQYGYYTTDATSGTFTTGSMSTNGARWVGLGNYSTPLLSSTFMHPDNLNHPAVRRYTVGTDNEPSISGKIIIQGKFWDSQACSSNGSIGFVTVDNVVLFSQDIPEGSTFDSGYISYLLEVDVTPGSTVDFGVTSKGNYGCDGRAMTAQIGLETPTSKTYRAVSSGNWSESSIWSVNINGTEINEVPGDNDQVIIRGYNVTVNSDHSTGSVYLSNQLEGTSLTILNGVLTVKDQIVVESQGETGDELLKVISNGKLSITQ